MIMTKIIKITTQQTVRIYNTVTPLLKYLILSDIRTTVSFDMEFDA